MLKFSLSLSVFLFSSSIFAVSVTVNTEPARCGVDNGSVGATAFDGIFPYTFAWSNGATSPTITGLAPGTYTVTVTDGLSNTAQATATVSAVWEMNYIAPYLIQPDCQNQCTGILEYPMQDLMGTPPYSIGPFEFLDPVPYYYMGVCAGDLSPVMATDLNGCSVALDPGFYVQTVSPAVISILSTSPGCPGGSGGTITYQLAGDASTVTVSGPGGSTVTYEATGVPIVVTGLAPGTYSLVTSLDPLLCTGSTVQAVVGSLSTDCGTVEGTVFNDADQNCIQDAGDIGLPFRVITIVPGPEFTMTDASGHYSRDLDFGSYTLTQPLLEEAQLCPVAVPTPFTLDNASPSVTVDLADSSFLALDLDVSLSNASVMRPGFPFHAGGIVRNNTPYPSGPVTLTLTYDPTLDPVSVGSGGVATWNYPSMAPYSSQNFGLSGALPADIGLLGQVFAFSVNASNTLTESTLTNNMDSRSVTVTGSYDPNDKTGTTSSRLSDIHYYLDQDAFIEYRVRFQNTGTAAAETVVIRDEIDTDLDISSLDIIGASHDFTPSFGEGRELVFTFDEIQLPDSTTDLLGSQGFVSYRIKPMSTILIGDVIDNTANIFFDFNPAIVTNTTSHVVDVSTGISTLNETRTLQIHPNPTKDMLFVTTGAISVQTLSADGRILDLPMQRTESGYAIDVSGLANGMYMIRTVNGVVRFIKQ